MVGASASARTIQISIFNFPNVEALSEVKIKFGSTECSAQNDCGVVAFEPLSDAVLLTVTAPNRASPGPASFTITYEGKGSPPPGMGLLDDYQRSAKVAEGTIMYSKLEVEIREFNLCLACGDDNQKPCFDDGLCGDGSEPIPASGADVAVPSSGGSVLTMKVMNAPDLTSKTPEGDCGPIGCLKGGLQVGTFIADVAIKRTVGAETIFEVDFADRKSVV